MGDDPFRCPADRWDGPAFGKDCGDGDGRGKDVGGDVADLSECIVRKRGSCGDGERLSGGPGCGLDGGSVPGAWADCRLSAARADAVGTPCAVRVRHHVWDELGVRL